VVLGIPASNRRLTTIHAPRRLGSRNLTPLHQALTRRASAFHATRHSDVARGRRPARRSFRLAATVSRARVGRPRSTASRASAIRSRAELLLWTSRCAAALAGWSRTRCKGDVLRGAAGSRLCDCRGRRRPSKDHTNGRRGDRGIPADPGWPGCPRIAWPRQLRSDLLYARTRVKRIGNALGAGGASNRFPMWPVTGHPGCARWSPRAGRKTRLHATRLGSPKKRCEPPQIPEIAACGAVI
jgi:hypothetical protein